MVITLLKPPEKTARMAITLILMAVAQSVSMNLAGPVLEMCVSQSAEIHLEFKESYVMMETNWME